MFRLQLFGSASIEGPTGPLTGRPVQRRRLALLALLAGARGRGVARDKLIALLWPDADAERARPMLSDSVYRINQAVGGEAIVSVADELRLSQDRLPCDVCEFAEAIAARDWERAVALYTGPFLDGFQLPGADEFERWVEVERGSLVRERGRSLDALVDEAETAGDTAAAVHWARLLATHDPFSSRGALRYLTALERAGERAAALQHARIHTLLMRTELGLEPDPSVAAFEERLRATTEQPAGAQAAGSSEPAASAGAERVSGGAEVPVVEGRASAAAHASPSAEPSHAGASSGRATPSSPAAIFAAERPRIPASILAVVVLAAVFMLGRLGRSVLMAAPESATAMVVLPFEDLSPTGDEEYFADGITEELIVRLAQIEGMNVVGRTSAFALKGRTSDVREIAAQLGVDAVLAGSVRRSGDRLRVVAQLMDARSGYQLWTETYEREAADVFAIQDEIARAIATRMRGGVSDADSARLAVVDTHDPQAYNLYLRGRYEWHRRTEQGLRAAARYFELATERAPSYARAWVGLGDAYAVLGFYDYLPPDAAFPRAADAARTALRLRPDLAEAHATLGYVALYYDWDWARAEAEFRRTIEIDPRYSTGRQWYANHLTAMGRFDEAEREMRAAQELDPLSLIANAALGWVLFFAGDYERAIAQCTRTLELNPEFELAYMWRGWAQEELRNYDAAARDLERAVLISDSSAVSVASLARLRALAGDAQQARTLLRSLDARRGGYIPSYDVAKVHAGLGDVDEALDWLERAHAERSHSMAFIAVDPQLAALRGEDRYRRLVRSLGLD